MDEESLEKFGGSGRGFLKSFSEDLMRGIAEERMEIFASLASDEERVKFVAEVVSEAGQEFPVVSVKRRKDARESRRLKECGNEAFVGNDNEKALRLYTEALSSMPADEDSATEKAIIFANRSASLYHMREYELAVGDIDRSLSLDYPKNLEYKIRERKGKCLLALGKHAEALEEFRKMLRALEDSELSSDKRLKMETDLQMRLRLLQKRGRRSSPERRAAVAGNDGEAEEPALCSTRHGKYVAACDKVDIFQEPKSGRYAAATADIVPGEVILTERPHCSVLIDDFVLTHCSHCFTRTVAPYPCGSCNSAVFCSNACRLSAEGSYHKYECPILDTVYASGVSVTVLMALRIITQRPLGYFLDGRVCFDEELRVYESSDYRTLFNLVRHEDIRPREDFFERAVMALFLLQALRRARYFPKSENGLGNLTASESYIGGLLLRHLQLLQFNAHEIFEIKLRRGQTWSDSTSVFIGGGIFPTLALFNHSCDPGVVRYFRGSTVVVRAIKPIRKGETIAENYGPMFTMTSRTKRRSALKSQYKFECECRPCTENWPTFREMNSQVLRFRCRWKREGNGAVQYCGGIIPVPHDIQEFMAKCPSCGQYTNLLGGLKTLQETDAMYHRATEHADAGKLRAALRIYLEILSMLHSVMAPPFRDYHLCQQAIRKCMLAFGNTFLSSTTE